MNQETHEKLLAPFADTDIEWRLQWTNDDKSSGRAVAYVTNRAIQYRLDSVLGFGNWRNEFIPWHSNGKKDSQLCGISIYFEARKEWITKYDGAEDSDIEPIKGGLSDSMKRAAVQWGLGRYLYSMDTVWVNTELRGRTVVIKTAEIEKLNKAHQEHIQKVFGGIQKPQPIQQSGPREVPPPKAAPIAPENCVWVNKVVTVPAPNGRANTNLQISDAGGNVTETFLQGEHPALVPGAVLVNTQFSKQEKNGVLFLMLDSYEIFSQAA